MNSKLTLGTTCVALLMVSFSVNAQGRRPSPAPATGQRPPSSQQLESRRFEATTLREEAEANRLQAEQRRLEAEHRRLDAEQRRVEAAENSQSEEARADHAPNDQAADEAFLAEQNAENADIREERPGLQGENRDDHGND